jgi:hypothetical protein
MSSQAPPPPPKWGPGGLDVLTKKIEDLENEVTSEKNKAGELRDLLEEAEAIKEMRRSPTWLMIDILAAPE